MKNKKGQLSLGDAPTVVLIVGLTFLIMATIAFIGEKYGAAMPSDKTAMAINESVTQAQLTTGTYALRNSSLCNSENFVVSAVYNSTGGLIHANNYSISGASGIIANLTGEYPTGDWKVMYTNDYSGVACDVTTDLQTNLSDNTSIAGIVLTISLVGIILTILIGVFIGVRKAGSRV